MTDDDDDILIDDIMEDFAVPPRYGMRRHSLRSRVPACSAKPGREEVELVMKVYEVGRDEAKKILKEKSARRREALEKRRAEEGGEEPPPPRRRRQ